MSYHGVEEHSTGANSLYLYLTRKIHREELPNLYSGFIGQGDKSRRMRRERGYLKNKCPMVSQFPE
jgi:hypothetical protein